MMDVGLESLSFYTPHYYFDLKELAKHRGVDKDKYYRGIGQEKMGMTPPDEDVVTMAANAAHHALERVDKSKIDTVIFGTETGIDQSKSAAIYVHSLVGLPSHCRSFEIKQACSGATAGLQLAQAYVAMNPDRKVLVLAADVARYDLESPGEATQGAGAVAMVVSAEPRILKLHPESGAYTEDVMDFWRPNYRDEAVVDGKYSIKVYLNALAESWKQYSAQTGRRFRDFERFVYHLPFTRMAEKAHLHLAKLADSTLSVEELKHQLQDTLYYSRITGNAYTASMYVGLAGLLDLCRDDLSGREIGLFSYGSGCMGTFFSGQVCAGYRSHLDTARHERMIKNRTALDYESYLDFFNFQLPRDGSALETAHHKTGLYRLSGIDGHKRLYEKVESLVEAETPAAAQASA